jgi:hypothetical protein
MFPSLLTVDGPKVATSASVAAELSQALSTALSLSDSKDELAAKPAAGDPIAAAGSRKTSESEMSKTRKSTAEINKLLQQHYWCRFSEIFG